MNRVHVNLEALYHNLSTIDGWMRKYGARWTVVTKVLCGNEDILRALVDLGVYSMGDTRMANLSSIGDLEGIEPWYLRIPHLSIVPDVVRYSQASLNSETEVIEALNCEAAKIGTVHRIIIMIELGDLREGILPGSLIRFYNHIFELPNIEVVGIGANIGCLAGVIPSIDQLMQLVLYRELLELKFNRPLPLISAGTSATLPLVLSGQLPEAVNHFRIGESLFLGSDLINNCALPPLRDDVFVLTAEIAELKKKSLVPVGELGSIRPFEVTTESADLPSPGQRGYRALVMVGELDTDVSGLTPTNPALQIAGASSDIIALNIDESDDFLSVGDTISFKLSYSALLRLMNCRYIPKTVGPLPEKLKNASERFRISPVLQGTGLKRTVSKRTLEGD